MSRAQSFPDNRQEFSGEFSRAWVSTARCPGGAADNLHWTALRGEKPGLYLIFWGLLL